MIDYRPIVSEDVPAVTALALEALRFGMGESALTVSPAKVQGMVQGFADEPGHFQLAAFKDGQPVGAIAAYVAEMPFFDWCEAHVLMCYCNEPHAGTRLIKAMLDWVNSELRIRRVIWAMNDGAEKFSRVLQRRFAFGQKDMLVYTK